MEIAGIRFTNREEFDAALARWYADAAPGEWVEPGVHAQKPSVRIEHSGVVFELKAETNREAVGRYLKIIRESPDAKWTVVPNERGGFNKFAIGDPPVKIEKFWMYLRRSDMAIARLLFR
jgi:hypothetical protein